MNTADKLGEEERKRREEKREKERRQMCILEKIIYSLRIIFPFYNSWSYKGKTFQANTKVATGERVFQEAALCCVSLGGKKMALGKCRSARLTGRINERDWRESLNLK